MLRPLTALFLALLLACAGLPAQQSDLPSTSAVATLAAGADADAAVDEVADPTSVEVATDLPALPHADVGVPAPVLLLARVRPASSAVHRPPCLDGPRRPPRAIALIA